MFARTVLGRIVILVALAAFLWAVFARDSGASGPTQRYRVEAGDTLWSIVESRYPGDPREAVWNVERRNHLTSATIAPGQVLVLP
jgi:nucleoid-associated protein YgaU